MNKPFRWKQYGRYQGGENRKKTTNFEQSILCKILSEEITSTSTQKESKK